jgi:hypothetical protein
MKPVAVLTAASLLALCGAASAQTPPSPPRAGTEAPARAEVREPGLSRAEMDSLTNARIAGIKAGLSLNTDQQRLFEPVEQALRATARDRAERVEQFRTARGNPPAERPDFAQRLERQAERMTRTAANLTALSSAMKPFYASLDDSQKRLLPLLVRRGGDHGRRMAMHFRDYHGMMGPGMREGVSQQPRP